ncbi:MAG TPA: peptide-methionine (S)-S-oxide reductase [Pyrinomonadaceae bacterium]|nr:peptide-methionine (S)-S-oxide reductase [Pyrinomonadaceae bacterium]
MAKRKFNFIFPSLPPQLIFILGMAFCPQAHSGQANMACFAGGCFWCTEEVFQQVPGVTSVVSGYMQNAETIQVRSDPTKISYDKLLNVFWRAHNPTEVDRQGPNVGKKCFIATSCLISLGGAWQVLLTMFELGDSKWQIW